MDVDTAGHLVAGVVGLAEVVAGVEEEDVDAGLVLGDVVRQGGVGHRAGHGAGGGVEVPGHPADDVGGVVLGNTVLRVTGELTGTRLGEGFEVLNGARFGAGTRRCLGRGCGRVRGAHFNSSSSTRWDHSENVSVSVRPARNRRTSFST